MNTTRKELLDMATLLENAASLAAMPKRDHALCQQAAEELRKFLEANANEKAEKKGE